MSAGGTKLPCQPIRRMSAFGGYAQQTACTVTCNFVTPNGIASVTCTQTVPGGAKDWYVCIRPAAGKSYGNLDSGSENRAKP